MRETKQEYVERQLSRAYQYEVDVLSGEVIASDHIRLAIQRRKDLADKYYFNTDNVKKVFTFLYYIRLTIHNKVQYLEPLSWFTWIILNIYGLYRDKECTKRLFTDALIFISRKNAKSINSAILALYEMLKGERNPETYILASTAFQASIILRYAKQIVKDSPALKKRVEIRLHNLRTTHNGTGIFKPLASHAERLDGLNPSIAIIDEAAVQPTKELYNILKTGQMARENPLMITISTAGFHKEYPFYNDVEIGIKVLNKDVENDTTFYALYMLDDPKEEEDPNMWVKANPSIGQIISLEDMVINYNKAKLTISDLQNFRVKNLNMWSDNESIWIPDEIYRECFVDSNIEEVKGLPAYIGVDLSASRDLASIVVVVQNPETNKIEVIPEFFFPTVDNESNKIRSSGIDLTEWIEKGYIIAHENKIIDYDKILERIKYYSSIFDVQGISYDAWSASILMSQIEAELMIDLYAAPQNTAYFNFPLKYIERLVFSKMINLSTNPVLRWHFSNIVLYHDGNDNIKILKNKSQDSVDGAVALAMALGLYAKLNFDSVSMIMESYEGEGLLLNKK